MRAKVVCVSSTSCVCVFSLLGIRNSDLVWQYSVHILMRVERCSYFDEGEKTRFIREKGLGSRMREGWNRMHEVGGELLRHG